MPGASLPNPPAEGRSMAAPSPMPRLGAFPSPPPLCVARRRIERQRTKAPALTTALSGSAFGQELTSGAPRRTFLVGFLRGFAPRTVKGRGSRGSALRLCARRFLP